MIGIYKVENKINGKIYIGQSIHIETRIRQHKQAYKTNPNNKFYKALVEYGIDNFDFSIIEECDSQLLDEREIYWIDYYNSYYDGYNSTPGGQKKYFNPNPFYELWDAGYRVGEIAEKLNCSSTTVQAYLKGYKDYNSHTSHVRGGLAIIKKYKQEPKKYNSVDKICQYSIYGELINKWDSAKQVNRELGINATAIGKVIKGERLTAGGFQWKKEGQEITDISNKVRHNNGVIQYDMNWNEIARYETILEASKEMKCDPKNISACAKGFSTTNNRQTACGYYWKFI